MSSKNANLGTEPIGKLLFTMAAPAIAAQLINVLYNIVDRMYIGHIDQIGPTALTGVGVTMPIVTLISAFSYFIGMGGAPQAAIHMGKGDNEKAEKILGNCVTGVFCISILLTAIILLFGEPILLALGASENTLPYALDYISIYAIGTIFVQMTLGLNPFISSQGFARISMFTTLIGAILNIVLDPVFIFVFGLDVRGAAIATVLSQCVSALWVLKFLTGKTTILHIRKKNLRPDLPLLFSIMALGISPFVMQSTESLIFICFNTSLQKFGGDLAVGAMTILSSCMQFAMLPIMGLTQGAQPITSFNFGAGNVQRVKQSFRLLLACCFVFTFCLWSAVMLVPQLFVGMFTAEAALSTVGIWALRIYMGTSCLFGIQTACQQTFIALGEAKSSVFLAVLRKIILLIPLIYLLPVILPDGITGFFLNESVSSLLPQPNQVASVLLSEPIADFLAVCVTSLLFVHKFPRILETIPARPTAQEK